jgi:hypothetical protein
MINIFMAQTAAALLQLARLGHGRVAFSMASVVNRHALQDSPAHKKSFSPNSASKEVRTTIVSIYFELIDGGLYCLEPYAVAPVASTPV